MLLHPKILGFISSCVYVYVCECPHFAPMPKLFFCLLPQTLKPLPLLRSGTFFFTRSFNKSQVILNSSFVLEPQFLLLFIFSSLLIYSESRFFGQKQTNSSPHSHLNFTLSLSPPLKLMYVCVCACVCCFSFFIHKSNSL